MAQRKTLTQQQVALLRWIADGCSDGEMEGYSYRVSAAALRGSQSGGIDYGHRALLAERFRKVPAGRHLEVRVVGEELEIVLVHAPEQVEELLELVPISVPVRVGRYHRCAREFRDLTARHEVSKAQLQRAVFLVHAIAVEAERRGWSAKLPEAGADRSGRVAWSGSRYGHFVVDAQGGRA